jgi:hypothetical protein
MNKQQIIRDYFSKIGKKGASAGGKARTSLMTPEERSALARKAVLARWAKYKANTKRKGTKKGGK